MTADHGCNRELRDMLLDLALDHCPEAAGAAAALFAAGFQALSALVGDGHAANIIAEIYTAAANGMPD